MLLLLEETLEDFDFAPADIETVLAGFRRYRVSVRASPAMEAAGA